MIDFKELAAGASAGGYALERWIRDDAVGSFFVATGDDGKRVLVKLAPGESPAAERQFARWLRARLLRHPNLLDVREVGRADLAGDRYIFSAYEHPDDLLTSALEQGPLSEAEARGVLESALAGLRYLHGQGLAHGKVDADHIVAVGETVKLTTDALGEPEGLAAYAEDVRQLGELVRRLRAPEPLGEPLATIARNATAADARDRWTLAEIAATLRAAPPAVVAPPVPTAEPIAAVAAPVAPAAPALEAPLPAPEPSPIAAVPTAEPPPAPVSLSTLPPPRHRGHETTREISRRPFPKWIIAGVAILLFSILMWNLRRKPAVPPAHPQPVAAVTPPAAPATNPQPPAARRRAESRPPKGVWRVIAFTYRSREPALKKAKEINTRWPELRAEIFTPKRRRGYYLVALGNWMSREEATQLERRARRMGLPRDTYAQNYSE